MGGQVIRRERKMWYREAIIQVRVDWSGWSHIEASVEAIYCDVQDMWRRCRPQTGLAVLCHTFPYQSVSSVLCIVEFVVAKTEPFSAIR